MPARVIRVADLGPEGGPERADRAQVRRLDRRGVLARAVEDRDPAARACPPLDRVERRLDLAERRHPGRQDDRQPETRGVAEERQIRDLPGWDLDPPDAQLDEQLQALDIERRRQELDVVLPARLDQCLVVTARQLQPADHLVLAFAGSRVADLIVRLRGVEGDASTGDERLELDDIGARLGRLGDELPGELDAPVVVHARLGDHEGGDESLLAGTPT